MLPSFAPGIDRQDWAYLIHNLGGKKISTKKKKSKSTLSCAAENHVSEVLDVANPLDLCLLDIDSCEIFPVL